MGGHLVEYLGSLQSLLYVALSQCYFSTYCASLCDNVTEDAGPEVYCYESVPWQLALKVPGWWKKSDVKDLLHRVLTPFYLLGVHVRVL